MVGGRHKVVRLQLNDVRVKQSLLQRADEILREVGADAFAYLSDTSPVGFDLRLADFVAIVEVDRRIEIRF